VVALLSDAAGAGRRTINTASPQQIDPESRHTILRPEAHGAADVDQ
jgi:hypothetical protein